MNWNLKVLQQYATFSGRARRKDYWMFFLFNVITSLVLAFLEGIVRSSAIQQGEPPLLSNIYTLAVFFAVYSGKCATHARHQPQRLVSGGAHLQSCSCLH